MATISRRYPTFLATLLTCAVLFAGCIGRVDRTSALTFVLSSSEVAASPTTQIQPPFPHFDHIVIVIEENKSLQNINSYSSLLPYITGYRDSKGKLLRPGLMQQGATFTNAHGEWHPSQPNYLALFSGLMPRKNVQDPAPGAVGDECPLAQVQMKEPNLAEELIMQGDSFKGYSEDLPYPGYLGCFTPGINKQTNTPYNKDTSPYVSKHSPWVNFADVPQQIVNLPWTEFPDNKHYNNLPTISFVIPNNTEHNMHAAQTPENKKWTTSLQDANDWLEKKLDNYIKWAKTHNSLFILTWDEDSSPQVCDLKKSTPQMCNWMYPSGVIQYQDKEKHVGTTAEYNIIPTIFVGAHIQPGKKSENCITHYDILRTLEYMYRLQPLGETKGRSNAIHAACNKRWTSQPIMDVWA